MPPGPVISLQRVPPKTVIFYREMMFILESGYSLGLYWSCLFTPNGWITTKLCAFFCEKLSTFGISCIPCKTIKLLHNSLLLICELSSENKWYRHMNLSDLRAHALGRGENYMLLNWTVKRWKRSLRSFSPNLF